MNDPRLNDALRNIATGIPTDSWAPKEPEGDFSVQNEGTISILWPDSPAAIAWCGEHIGEPAQRWGKNGYVIEHRYIAGVVDGMIRDELKLKEK